MVGKVELDSTIPIIQTVCRRSPQMPGTNVFICLRRGADLSAIVSQTDRRPLQIIWKPGLRQRLHERGFTSIRFHDFQTTAKSMRFGSVYTESFSPGNRSHDGISERYTTC